MWYLATVGMNYPGLDGSEVRVEAGEVRNDFPEESLPWLLELGHVVPAAAPESVPPAPEPAPAAPHEELVSVEVPADQVAQVEALLHDHDLPAE